jgi:hypothetical protein
LHLLLRWGTGWRLAGLLLLLLLPLLLRLLRLARVLLV